MTTHIIIGGVVVNTIVASATEAQAAFPEAICIAAATGGIGWLWDGETLTPPPAPVVPMAELKAAKNAEINAARLAANFSTFLHNGKEIACDQLSRSDIDGVNGYVGINGTLPPDFPGAWKAVDNSYLVINSVESWKAFYLSMYNAGLGHFMKSQQLKAQVDACTTAEEIEAIKW